jgi:hypothetical protein
MSVHRGGPEAAETTVETTRLTRRTFQFGILRPRSSGEGQSDKMRVQISEQAAQWRKTRSRVWKWRSLAAIPARLPRAISVGTTYTAS